tara:strand:- start:644 stop:1057 length:414 start_codon:yes stop_codon:yes gene_type:complete
MSNNPIVLEYATNAEWITDRLLPDYANDTDGGIFNGVIADVLTNQIIPAIHDATFNSATDSRARFIRGVDLVAARNGRGGFHAWNGAGGARKHQGILTFDPSVTDEEWQVITDAFDVGHGRALEIVAELHEEEEERD